MWGGCRYVAVMSNVQQVPAGWYPDAVGQQRWWDGQQWGVVATPVVYVREQKSLVATYLLWFFLGGFGVHHFYTRNVGAGVAMLLLNVAGWALTVVLIGWFVLAVFLVWWIIDAFLIPSYVTRANNL